MIDTKKTAKNSLYKFAKIAFIFASIPLILIALLLYPNWAAGREAEAFCNEIKTGQDVRLLIAEFEQRIGFERKEGGKVSARHYGFPQEGFAKDSHTFLFPGFMFDRAVCFVSLNPQGKVTSKYVGVQND